MKLPKEVFIKIEGLGDRAFLHPETNAAEFESDGMIGVYKLMYLADRVTITKLRARSGKAPHFTRTRLK